MLNHQLFARAWLRVEQGFAAQEGRLVGWVALAAMAGAAFYVGWRGEPARWLGPGLVLGGAALACGARRLVRRGAGLVVLGFGAGFCAAAWQVASAPPFFAVPHGMVEVRGIVAARETTGACTRLVLRALALDGVPAGPRQVRLTLRAGDPGVAEGGGVAVPARLFAPAPPALPGGRDPRFEAWISGLGASGYAIGRVRPVAPAPAAGGFADWLTGLRERIGRAALAALPGPRGAIASMLLSGEGGAIAPADRAAFQAAGLSHLLAIAGLHVAIVMASIGLGVRYLLLWSESLTLRLPVGRVATFAGFVGGLVYLALTGAHLPTRRSLIMAGIVVLGLISGRQPVSIRAWAIAALAIVLVSPGAVVGPSFQMSFAAVLALIAGYQSLGGWWQGTGGRGFGGGGGFVLRHGAGLALTSVLAGTACLPFIAYHFHAVQPYFVLANLVAVPLTAILVLPAGLLALVLWPLGLAGPAWWAMGQGIGGILMVARGVAALPGAVIAAPMMPGMSLIGSVLALAALCLGRGWLRRLAPPLLGAAALAWIAGRPPDLLIAPDGRSAALIGGGVMQLAAPGGADRYLVAQWREWLGKTRMVPADCPQMRCAVVAEGGGWRFTPADPGCGAPIRLGESACAGGLHWDRRQALAEGAAMVWLAAPAHLVSDAALRGRRPWTTQPPALAAAAGAAGMLAAAETLPPEPERFDRKDPAAPPAD